MAVGRGSTPTLARSFDTRPSSYPCPHPPPDLSVDKSRHRLDGRTCPIAGAFRARPGTRARIASDGPHLTPLALRLVPPGNRTGRGSTGASPIGPQTGRTESPAASLQLHASLSNSHPVGCAFIAHRTQPLRPPPHSRSAPSPRPTRTTSRCAAFTAATSATSGWQAATSAPPTSPSPAPA